MGVFSIWHWLIVVLIVAIPIWLAARILGKAGISRWWAILNVIPVVNLVMIWVFAFIDWPIERNKPKNGGSTRTAPVLER